MDFSIVIPSYNRNESLNEALKELSLQTILNFEVIVVDDNSPTPVEVNESYPFEIRVIRNKNNFGPAKSRNIGVENSNCEWIVFLDDDDIFERNKIEILTDTINVNKDINFIYHQALIILKNESKQYVTSPEPDITKLTLQSMLYRNQIGGSSMIAIKKVMFISVGGFNYELKAVEDYEFLLRVVSSDLFRPYFLNKTLTEYSSVTKKNSVSKNLYNTLSAFDFIENTYGTTESNRKSIHIHKLSVIAYIKTVNMERSSSIVFFKLFMMTKSIKYFIASISSLISPKLTLILRSKM